MCFESGGCIIPGLPTLLEPLGSWAIDFRCEGLGRTICIRRTNTSMRVFPAIATIARCSPFLKQTRKEQMAEKLGRDKAEQKLADAYHREIKQKVRRTSETIRHRCGRRLSPILYPAPDEYHGRQERVIFRSVGVRFRSKLFTCFRLVCKAYNIRYRGFCERVVSGRAWS